MYKSSCGSYLFVRASILFYSTLPFLPSFLLPFSFFPSFLPLMSSTPTPRGSPSHLLPHPHSVPNALLAFAGANTTLGVGSDYFLLALQNGHLSVAFNNIGGLQVYTESGTSTGVYNDAEIHQLILSFQERTLDVVVDSNEHIRLTSKKRTEWLLETGIVNNTGKMESSSFVFTSHTPPPFPRRSI